MPAPCRPAHSAEVGRATRLTSGNASPGVAIDQLFCKDPDRPERAYPDSCIFRCLARQRARPFLVRTGAAIDRLFPNKRSRGGQIDARRRLRRALRISMSARPRSLGPKSASAVALAPWWPAWRIFPSPISRHAIGLRRRAAVSAAPMRRSRSASARQAQTKAAACPHHANLRAAGFVNSVPLKWLMPKRRESAQLAQHIRYS